MSDLNDLTKPDLQSAYANGDVPDTLLGHIKRLWIGDYTGMANLVPNMLKWAITGTTTLSARLYRRNSSGQEVEVTVLPGVSIGGNAATATTSASCSGNAATASSAPASDVYSWAKQASKPSYSWDEINSRPTNISSFSNDSGYLTASSYRGELSAGGYTKIPNGMILQWGKTPSIPISGSFAITFPISFPNVCFVILCSAENTSTANSFSVSHGTPSNTGATLYSNGAVAAPQTWVAIGY